MENTKEKINGILMEIMVSKGVDINCHKMDDNTHLANDLGFSSLDMAQMIIELQEQFNYDPLDNGVLLSDITTAGSLYKIFHLESIS